MKGCAKWTLESLLDSADGLSQLVVLKIQSDDAARQQALLFACSHGQLNEVEAALQHPLNPNIQDEHAI